MKVCIIDYGMGNITSVKNALLHLNYDVTLVSEPDMVAAFDIVILPGVGAFAKAMEILRQRQLDTAIIEAAKSGKMIIGICLGMQLLLTRSHEFGETKGLNLVSGEVLPFKLDSGLRVPHMGWNKASSTYSEFTELNGDYYFVHSFYCMLEKQEDVRFSTEYGIEFCSGLKHGDRIFGFQFHPEKSQKLGISLLNKTLRHA